MGLIALVPTPLVRAPGALFGPGEDPLNPAMGEGIGATFLFDIPSTSSCLLRTALKDKPTKPNQTKPNPDFSPAATLLPVMRVPAEILLTNIKLAPGTESLSEPVKITQLRLDSSHEQENDQVWCSAHGA